MSRRTCVFALLGLVFAAATALAQTYPAGGAYPPSNANPPGIAYPPNNANPNNAAPVPDQPVRPNLPTIVPRSEPSAGAALPPQGPPPPPFVLTPEQEAQVDRVLQMWEQRNRDIKKFESKFKRWTYDGVFGRPDVPKYVDIGNVYYAAPDRGVYEVNVTEEGGRRKAIGDERAEKWISDGKSVFEYDYKKRKLIEHKLPPDQQGKAIANGPLPFLFGSEAKALKQRYWIRLVTPANSPDKIWLEAHPRYQQDAANFHHAQFIISTQGMAPFALKLIQPNQKDSLVYQFFDIGVNLPGGLFSGDPTRASVPFGWQKVIDDRQLSQAQPPAGGIRK